MKQGDFTALAAAYRHRPAYSLTLLRALQGLVAPHDVAEVGAGTGKLTEQLLELGLAVTAVEPNEAMRAEGMAATEGQAAQWHAGSGEEAGLPTESADWLLMASAFHWTDPDKSLPEFARVLRSGGYLTLLWNPRDLESSPLQLKIDTTIREMVPELERRSSGAAQYTDGLDRLLLDSGRFSDVLFCEARHVEQMTPERYLGAWRSVNDIQAQAGADRWAEILAYIESEVADLTEVEMPYKTRAWTARVVK